MTLATIKGIALHSGRLCMRQVESQRYYLRIAPSALFIPADVPLMCGHNQYRRVAGATLAFEDDGDRLTFRATLPDTSDGFTALRGVRDGSCAGASLGFTIRRHEAEEVDCDLVVTVVRARVRELSLVDEPAIRGCTAEVAGSEDQAGKEHRRGDRRRARFALGGGAHVREVVNQG